MYRKTSSLVFVRPLLHCLVLGGLFWLFYRVRLLTDLVPGVQIKISPIVVSELITFSLISIMIFLFLCAARGIYSLSCTTSYPQNFFRVWLWRFLMILMIAFLGSDYIFPGGISRLIVLFVGFSSLVVLSLVDILWSRFLIFLKVSSSRVLCICDVSSQRSLSIDGFSSQDDLVRCSFDGFLEMSDLDGYDKVVVIGQYTSDQIQLLFDRTRLINQDFYHLPASGFLEDVVYEPIALDSLRVFRLSPSTLSGVSLIVKRFFDIIGSLLALVFLSPVMIMIALAVKFSSRGPIFYYQKRIGKRNLPFTFVKFRSMYVHLSTGEGYGGEDAAILEKQLNESDSNTRDAILSKIENDPRVTRVGRFLRRTSLDELPQLFCVLGGTMSLVGPRPHLPREVEKYEDRHTRLFAIKPGITGYAQIFGRDRLGFDEEAKLDLKYIQNWSLWLDIYAIIKTVGVMFKGR